MRQLLFFIFFTIFAVPAKANECDEATTQSAMNQCADLDFRQVDSQLNEAYQELRAAYQSTGGAVAALRTAQKAWIAFRDAECAMTRISSGGTAERMTVAQCMTRITTDRLADFRRLLSCTEGDFSCIQLDSAAD